MLGRLGSRKYKSTFDFPKEKVEMAHRAYALNYGDRDIGIRNPDWPGGVLIGNSGVLDIYAGNAHLYMNLKGDTLALADRFAIQATSIFLSPANIKEFSVLGRMIDEAVFEGKKKVLTPKKPLGQYFALIPTSRVQEDGSIQPVVPLSDIFEAVEMFPKYKYKSLDEQTFSILKENFLP